MSSIEETKGIRAVMIIEVIGRPPEHIAETLNSIIKQIGEEKRVSIKETKINEPVLMKDQKDFYTSFAEIEFEAEEILDIAALMFKYMPAHIEIISPELIALTNNGWNEIFNEMIRKLHGYDEIARIIQTEKMILEKKLKDILGRQQEKKTADEKSAKKNSSKKKE